MKPYKILLASIVSAGILMTSCTKDLDTIPLDTESITSATVFDDTTAYVQFLSKLYGSLILTGQQGPTGTASTRDFDPPGTDEGQISFWRLYWIVQEVSTDEAVCAWGGDLLDINAHSWSDQTLWLELLYKRVFINIAFCNEYVRIVGSKVGDLSGNLKTDVNTYIAEARFLRAFYYFVALDLWGNVPFTTEDDPIGAFLPEQTNRADLFAYIESELKAIAPILLPPNQDPNYYARANRAASWMLLSRLYLNAETYLGAGNTKYTESIAYTDSVISAGYSLNSSYRNLFLGDNHTLQNEIIFPIAENAFNTQCYGGTMWIIHASCVGANDAAAIAAQDYYGIQGSSGGGWNGNRFTETFSNDIFDDITGNTDKRALFYIDTAMTREVTTIGIFRNGYQCAKFINRYSTGQVGPSDEFVDNDFPVCRLAEAYLTYAEAVLRGGSGGNIATAVGYINDLRERAYGDNSGNITASDLTLDFILNEKARELYWEGHRRTDLIRYGYFTGSNYMWDWKGGVIEGRATDSRNNLMPLPSVDLGLNTNLVQNPGY